MSENPFLKVDNPYDGVNNRQKDAQDYEREFERLCWSVWHQSVDGKELYERLKQRFLLQTQINPMSPTASSEAIWWDGFRSGLIGLYNLGTNHIKRVNTEGLNG